MATKTKNTTKLILWIVGGITVCCIFAFVTFFIIEKLGESDPSVQTDKTARAATRIANTASTTSISTESIVITWEGVYIGMPADDVLLKHPIEETTADPEQIGSDADGLIVRWSYPGAYLILARRDGSCSSNVGGVNCYSYRVIEIILR